MAGYMKSCTTAIAPCLYSLVGIEKPSREMGLIGAIATKRFSVQLPSSDAAISAS
jgi:hypothetical protein